MYVFSYLHLLQLPHLTTEKTQVDLLVPLLDFFCTQKLQCSKSSWLSPLCPKRTGSFGLILIEKKYLLLIHFYHYVLIIIDNPLTQLIHFQTLCKRNPHCISEMITNLSCHYEKNTILFVCKLAIYYQILIRVTIFEDVIGSEVKKKISLQ